MDIIKKQRAKFTAGIALIASVLLAVLVGGFFGVSYASNEKEIENILQKGLSAQLAIDASLPKDIQCMYIFVDSYGEAFCDGKFDNYGALKDEIKNAAIERQNGKFDIDGHYFSVASKDKSDGKMYVVLDRTSLHEQFVNTSVHVAILYIVAVALVSVLAFFCSAQLLRPVSDAFSKQRDLIANASHELKTPLTVISTNLSVIKSEPQQTVEESAKWIEVIDGQLIRMQDLIKNMLELSRIEQSQIKDTDVDLSNIASSAVLTFEVPCFEKNVQMTSEIEDNLHIMGDPATLERLFVILLDNAVKYCGENGKVGVKLSSEKKHIVLKVLNTGEVISKEDAEHVFDRFYRTDGARAHDDSGSFGLGLSIAAAIVKNHGGAISCRGVEGKGTVFTVTLPKKRSRHNKKSAD